MRALGPLIGIALFCRRDLDPRARDPPRRRARAPERDSPRPPRARAGARRAGVFRAHRLRHAGGPLREGAAPLPARRTHVVHRVRVQSQHRAGVLRRQRRPLPHALELRPEGRRDRAHRSSSTSPRSGSASPRSGGGVRARARAAAAHLALGERELAAARAALLGARRCTSARGAARGAPR